MASKTTLNAGNLEALGAERLAALLIELSAGNANAKRRLRLELAGTASPREVAKEIRKRLNTIARSRTFVDWQNRNSLLDDLETQSRAIVTHVLKADPAEALDLMWRFLALAESVFARCDDSSGKVIGVFHAAIGELAEVAKAAKADPVALADQTFQALVGNGYGQYESLVSALAPALGVAGLAHLKQRMVALGNQSVPRPAPKDRRVIGWSMNGPIHADEMEESYRFSTVREALMAIADEQDDVDGFIGQYDEKTRKTPAIAAEIAQRLLAKGRVGDAARTLDEAERQHSGWEMPDSAWQDAHIDVLEAQGRGDDAQAARWAYFEKALSAPHLRAYLKRLPDFDDVEAEERALRHVSAHKDVMQALLFLVTWPALDKGAGLIVQQVTALDGDQYELLVPVAEALAGRYPLAATIALRAMIDFALTHSRSSRYQHSARHLMECAGLAPSIRDFAGFEAHDAYVTRLKAAHGRKTSFWNQIR